MDWKAAGKALVTFRHGLVNWALCIAGLAALGGGVYQLFNDHAAPATAGLGAGLILLLAASIERFELVKGLGIEARVNRKLHEADVALAQVKRITEIAGSTLVGLVARTGRWDGAVPPRETYALSRTVRQMLESVGASPEAVRAATQPWARWAAFDLAISVLSPYYEAVHRLSPVPGDNWLGRDAQDYAAALMEGWTAYPLDRFTARLRQVLESPPAFVPAELLTALRDGVRDWSPDIDYVAAHHDFSNVERCITRIEWQQGGRR